MTVSPVMYYSSVVLEPLATPTPTPTPIKNSAKGWEHY
jgi:hypothetical protein